MGTAIKHPVPDRGLSRHLQFLTSGHSDAQPWASECPDVKNYKWRLNPVWHGILYICTHMATVGVKGWTLTSVTVCCKRWTVTGAVVVLCSSSVVFVSTPTRRLSSPSHPSHLGTPRQSPQEHPYTRRSWPVYVVDHVIIHYSVVISIIPRWSAFIHVCAYIFRFYLLAYIVQAAARLFEKCTRSLFVAFGSTGFRANLCPLFPRLNPNKFTLLTVSW